MKAVGSPVLCCPSYTGNKAIPHSANKNILHQCPGSDTTSAKGGPKSKVQLLDFPTWKSRVFFFFLLFFPHQGALKINWLA